MNFIPAILILNSCLQAYRAGADAVKSEPQELDSVSRSFSLRQSRYSYFWTIEYYCTEKCRRNGKPYGRLIGTVCRCFCPQLDEVDYCTAAADRSCSMYCKKQGYSTGDCIYQDKCFCFCRPGQPYPPCTGDNPIPQYLEFNPHHCDKNNTNSTNATSDAGAETAAVEPTDDTILGVGADNSTDTTAINETEADAGVLNSTVGDPGSDLYWGDLGDLEFVDPNQTGDAEADPNLTTALSRISDRIRSYFSRVRAYFWRMWSYVVY